jgi:hypothetical protein
MRFMVTPAVQEWTNMEVFANTFKAGLRKVAILASGDIITQLSAEQTFDEEIAKRKQNRFFDKEETALAWLNEK